MTTTSLEAGEGKASHGEGKATNGDGKASAKGNGLVKDRSTNGDTRIDPHAPWTSEAAAKLYGIQQWGQGYFSVNDEGHVVVHPTQDPARSLDLKKLVDELRE